MAHFKTITATPPEEGLVNAVIMGRKTWESIPPKFRPLKDRTNVVLTRSPYPVQEEGVHVSSSLEEAVRLLQSMEKTGDVFVIGGGEVYKESIESGLVKRVIYTEVSNLPEETETKLDTFFPELVSGEWECKPYPGQICDDTNGNEEEEKDSDSAVKAILHTDKKSGIQYRFLDFYRKEAKDLATVSKTAVEEGAHVNPEEMQYLEMCKTIIETGVERGDRTGTGTLSQFGTQMRFSLRDGTLPLLTTKRTFWRGVAEELLWFISVRT